VWCDRNGKKRDVVLVFVCGRGTNGGGKRGKGCGCGGEIIFFLLEREEREGR
jgi:hypothetical protein